MKNLSELVASSTLTLEQASYLDQQLTQQEPVSELEYIRFWAASDEIEELIAGIN